MRAGWVSGAESQLGVLGISASAPDTGRWYLAIACSYDVSAVKKTLPLPTLHRFVYSTYC